MATAFTSGCCGCKRSLSFLYNCLCLSFSPSCVYSNNQKHCLRSPSKFKGHVILEDGPDRPFHRCLDHAESPGGGGQGLDLRDQVVMWAVTWASSRAPHLTPHRRDSGGSKADGDPCRQVPGQLCLFLTLAWASCWAWGTCACRRAWRSCLGRGPGSPPSPSGGGEVTGHLEACGQTLRPTEMPECGASGVASLSRAVTVQDRVCLPRCLAEFL